MKILIAEDDENSRVLLENVLSASGYEVFTAANGLEAMALLERQVPDLIISDILMPEMDGYTLCRTIRSDEKRFSTIPLVFYTATYTDPQDQRFAFDIGCTAFLIKPMEMHLFLKEIKSILEQHNRSHNRTNTAPVIPKNNCLLNRNYTHILSKKLDKKIEDLEQEREKLRQSEQKYKRIVESLRQEYFFYSQDKNGYLTYVSPSVEMILGYHPDEFLTHFTQFLSNHDINAKARESKTKGMTGNRQPSFEMDFLHKEGSPRRIEVSEEPIADAKGRLISIEGIARDITQKKKQESRIRQIHKMEALGTLAGGVAHDFNNILSVILGYTDMIKNDFDETHPSWTYFERIQSAGARAKSLISQILTYSRRSEKKTEWVRVQDVLNETLKLLRPALSSIIEIDKNIAPGCRPVQADSTQIHQVIMNLITNASYAIKGQPGKITIRLSEIDVIYPGQMPGTNCKQGPYLMFEVSDTGCGIHPSDLGNIFDPYFTTKKKGEGTGLGLAMVNSIVSGLDGHISVDTQIGKGTHFKIYLPCRPATPSGKMNIPPTPH